MVICGNCCYSQQQPKRQNTNLLLPITELSSFPIHGIEHCRQIADRLQTDCRQIADILHTQLTHLTHTHTDGLLLLPPIHYRLLLDCPRGAALWISHVHLRSGSCFYVYCHRRICPPGLDGDGRCRKVFHRCFHNGLRRMAFRAQVTNAEGTRATASRRFPP